MGYIIARKNAEKLLKEPHWLLLYGRRKVGKTFLLRDLCGFKNYFIIKTDLSVISPKENISLEALKIEAKNLLFKGETVVIDEFQRLNMSFLEDLASIHPRGKLILSGSSLRVIKKIFEPQSPLLGFFVPIKLGFIFPLEILGAFKKKLNFEKNIELSAFLREPWIVPLYNNEQSLEFLYKLITLSKQVIRSLIGEVFTEEEREMTKKYEALISLVGSGIWNTKELALLMYSRGLIPDSSQTHIIQYLKNLLEMELVESIKLNKTKGNYYRLYSPIMNIYYYLDNRYDISNRDISFNELKPTLQKLFSFEIQNFIADLFAEIYNGRKEYFVSKEQEVDFIITIRNKNEVVGEVKWKKLEKEDLGKFRLNSEKIHGKKILICKDSHLTRDGDIEIYDAKSLWNLINKLKKNK
jgi:hypothetical protein